MRIGGPWDQHFTSSAGVLGGVHPVVVCVLGAWLRAGDGADPAWCEPSYIPSARFSGNANS